MHNKFFKRPRLIYLKQNAMRSSLVLPQVNTGSERYMFSIILMFIERDCDEVLLCVFSGQVVCCKYFKYILRTKTFVSVVVPQRISGPGSFIADSEVLISEDKSI